MPEARHGAVPSSARRRPGQRYTAGGGKRQRDRRAGKISWTPAGGGSKMGIIGSKPAPDGRGPKHRAGAYGKSVPRRAEACAAEAVRKYIGRAKAGAAARWAGSQAAKRRVGLVQSPRRAGSQAARRYAGRGIELRGDAAERPAGRERLFRPAGGEM